MKRIIAIAALLLVTALFAQTDDLLGKSLTKIAEEQQTPSRKLVAYLQLPPETHFGATFGELELDAADLARAMEAYFANEPLTEVAKDRGLPVKKLVQYLAVEELDTHKPMTEQGVSPADLDKAQQQFNDNLGSYMAGIVMVGMSVVFISLIITGFIINQLRHLDPQNRKKEQAKPVAEAKKQPEPEPDVSTNAIVAVITALNLHVREVEEKRKLNLSWRRAPISMWRAGKVAMPNREFVLTRRK